MKNKASEWLAAKRKEKNWSLREMGERTGLTHTTIAKAESGDASFETWKALAEYFGESPQLVWSWAEKIDAIPEADQWTLETQRKISKLKTPRYKQIVLSLIETLSQQEQEELKSKK